MILKLGRTVVLMGHGLLNSCAVPAAVAAVAARAARAAAAATRPSTEPLGDSRGGSAAEPAGSSAPAAERQATAADPVLMAVAAAAEHPVAAARFRIEQFSPQGSVKGVRQATARFSSAVVALGDAMHEVSGVR